MRKIRIGKDIIIKWKVTINTGLPLDEADLTLVMVNPKLLLTTLDFTIEDNEYVVAKFKGVDHKCCGVHKLTLWLNRGKENQSALDSVDAFRLVMFTSEEEDDDESIANEVVELEGEITTTDKGEKGDKGDTGNGIESTELNSDYTLTINYTDGTSYTTTSIRGEKGEKGDRGEAVIINVSEQALIVEGTNNYNNY